MPAPDSSTVPFSALYECEVTHRRLRPKEHHFAYRVFYLWLDLDELDAFSESLALFKRNRWSLFSFFDSDHIPKGPASARENILAVMREAGVDTEEVARVRLLTFPRVLGHIFNPVCFYYAYDAEENPVCAVAEVTNTFHEQKPYVLTGMDWKDRFRLVTPKHFYVSPFSGLDLEFDFKLRLPGEALEIHVDERDDAGLVLLSVLTGKRRELTDASLLACAVKYPLLTLRVVFLIHWHALRLWMKKLAVHRKAADPHLQTGVYRPHRSIAPTQT
ncbi:MAG TPA: DUF1365 domain-containing protein [Prosthecobacter sp.]|nr:DUF1365 domain-containing protein [Prosthecobacter sp.]HRK14422.1 DUF1365 domain-containing protein [Prosthecobacter sp.]